MKNSLSINNFLSFRERDDFKKKYDMIEQNYEAMMMKYEECNRENILLNSKISRLEKERSLFMNHIENKIRPVIYGEENKTRNIFHNEFANHSNFRNHFIQPTTHLNMSTNSNYGKKDLFFITLFNLLI